MTSFYNIYNRGNYIKITQLFSLRKQKCEIHIQKTPIFSLIIWLLIPETT